MTTRSAFALALAVGLAGCSGKPSERKLSETEDRLLTFGKAYIQASAKLDRGPKNFDEVKPFLPANVSSDLMRSANDGEEFVVLWGVDFNKLPPGSDPYYVGAYEKTGSGSRRYVLRFPIGVVAMTHAELKAAQFPMGHSPPP
jgi:hypothetical protein